MPERRAALDALAIHATTLRIPVVELEGGTLTSLAGFDGHQGVALVARPRPVADMETILAAAHQRDELPFVLVLDSLEDPQNFGTLLRSGEAAGVHGVVYPTHRAAPLSPAAIKAAAGATEHLLLAAVDDLPGMLADLHGRGLRIVAAEEDAPLTYAEADLRGPLAIVVGSEGRGISAPIRRRLDLSVRIPMRGRIGSLNAAVAGSVLLFAAAEQRPMRSASAVARPAEAAPTQPTDQPGEESQPTPTKLTKKSAIRAKKSAVPIEQTAATPAKTPVTRARKSARKTAPSARAPKAPTSSHTGQAVDETRTPANRELLPEDA